MRGLVCVLAALGWLAGAVPGHAAGVSFPGEKCAFDYWPQTGWVVAPSAESSGGNRLLRASHDPRLGLAIEAWAGPIPAGPDDELGTREVQRTELTKRGWRISQINRAPVGGMDARRARAHRRAASQVFVLDEYQFDAAGRRFTLRVTGRGVGALQNPRVTRWLQSFRLL